MRILIIHNHYQIRGGEDAVAKAEAALLEDRGHEVIVYNRSNAELEAMSALDKLRYLFRLRWSKRTYDEVSKLIREFKPDVAHFHNIFFMVTPSAYDACRDHGVAVVQSLHNFRLLCANGLFYREKNICEKCLKLRWWPGIFHGCYRGSRALTVFVAQMLSHHWRRKTWQKKVDCFITATDFTRQKYLSQGMPAERFFVKPNFIYPDPGDQGAREPFALYIGRLSDEKGIEELLRAWETISFPLKVMGDGPLLEKLKLLAQNSKASIEFMGFAQQDQYDRLMRRAQFLIVPSRCYENFPRIVAEAFAYGLPVLSSRLGSLKEIITDGVNGMFFDPNDLADLAAKIRELMDNPQLCVRLGKEARRIYSQKYVPQVNHDQLVAVYRKAKEFSRERA